jgi:hypothetical protein
MLQYFTFNFSLPVIIWYPYPAHRIKADQKMKPPPIIYRLFIQIGLWVMNDQLKDFSKGKYYCQFPIALKQNI